jgi:hypothetical protein
MKEERIALSAKERERLRVLHEVKRGHLRQIDAARRLRLSDRQVRRLLERVGKVGDRGLAHGLRGRPSNRKIPADLEQRSAVCDGCGCRRIWDSAQRSPPSIWRGTGCG